jgi:hypothetical protein
MSDAALKSLSLTAFRGSVGRFTLSFETSRKLTLVYGENGTGKTTICDGLEFLAKGDVGSLQDKGMGKSLEKYWPSAGKSLADIDVVLERHDGTSCTGCFEGKQPVFKPASNRPLIELLRRRQITDLVETQPAERYKALKRFIDVEGVESSEDALRSQSKQVEEDRASAEQQETSGYVSLQDLFESAGKPGGDGTALARAEALIKEPPKDSAAELAAVEKLVAAITTLAAYPELLAGRLEIRRVAQDQFDAAHTALEGTLVAAGGDAAETLKLLQAGQAFLHSHPGAEVCPLCESPDKAEGLSNAIEARLGQLVAVQEAQGGLTKARLSLNAAQASLAQLEADYAATLSDYLSAKVGFDWGPNYVFPIADPPTAVTDAEQWLLTTGAPAQSWKLAEADLRNGSHQQVAVGRAVARIENSRKRKEEAGALKPCLQQALEICEVTRRAFTDKVMGEIAEEVGKLYELVHPGEGLEKIAFALDPKKRASIEIEAKFAGKDVPPTAYFSQSHLDTLGLCVFLALALREKAEEKILILDDVLGSVDDPHVDRVISMLYSVASRFRHAIITTHYRPWREKFRWGRLRPDQSCQFVELTGWTLDGGMRTRNMLPEVERLRRLLAEPEADADLQSIVGKAGVILEETLDFLTLQFGCSVPRRHGASYTLGDLLPNVSGKLRSALRVEVVCKNGAGESVASIDLKPILDALQTIAQTRNVMGAHFNVLSYDLLEADALNFGSEVLQLSEALVCPDYGWPSRDKSGSYWDNGGGTRRLHPLKKPA